MQISDEPVSSWSDELSLPPGEIGEIVVSGAHVSRRYHGASRANALYKISDGERIWHRTGDLGSIDEKGRVWFCGRKSQRVVTARGTLFTVQWEGVFNAHPDVHRSALVGVGPEGKKEPVVCVELVNKGAGADERRRIEAELWRMASDNPLTRGVKAFLFHPSFPVDVRHNAKIGRGTLALWAEAVLSGKGNGSKTLTRLRELVLARWVMIRAERSGR